MFSLRSTGPWSGQYWSICQTNPIQLAPRRCTAQPDLSHILSRSVLTQSDKSEVFLSQFLLGQFLLSQFLLSQFLLCLRSSLDVTISCGKAADGPMQCKTKDDNSRYTSWDSTSRTNLKKTCHADFRDRKCLKLYGVTPLLADPTARWNSTTRHNQPNLAKLL